MSTIEEQEKLLQVLRFTPRIYKILMWGYGGEYVMGTVKREIYDYFRNRRLNLTNFAWDSDYAEDNNIPEDMWPFPPGSWYEGDDMGHCHGVDRNAGTLQIQDENGKTVYERALESITGYEDCDGNPEPEWSGGDEVWIGSKPEGTVVFLGVSNEKGTFFEGEIELKQPFDPRKLELGYDEFDGNEIVNRVTYDGEDIDNWGGDTNGKSSEFGFYLVKSGNKWDRYCTMDDINYTMTDWFSNKVKPVREGNYLIKTPGKNSWEHQALWTGNRWISAWTEEADYATAGEVKIKQWRGISFDPDELEIREDLDKIAAEFQHHTV